MNPLLFMLLTRAIGILGPIFVEFVRAVFASDVDKNGIKLADDLTRMTKVLVKSLMAGDMADEDKRKLAIKFVREEANRLGKPLGDNAAGILAEVALSSVKRELGL